MPKLFISYARSDVLMGQSFIHVLESYGATVWRDEVNLYGGQRWPEALGDAIDANDVLVLVWSRHAATSNFVNQEWNTAVASAVPGHRLST